MYPLFTVLQSRLFASNLPPICTNSEFLRTEYAYIQSSYCLKLSLKPMYPVGKKTEWLLTRGTYFEILYQNPLGGPPIRQTELLDEKIERQGVLLLRSPPLNGFSPSLYYLVRILVWIDDRKTLLQSVHHQYCQMRDPEDSLRFKPPVSFL